MGMTYTFCYCTYNRKCKSRLGEKKEETFDPEHWGEIKDNLGRYLAEDVCVPGAEKQVRIPSVAVQLLSSALGSVAVIRATNTTNASECLEALSGATANLARIGEICQRLNEVSPGNELPHSLATLTADEPSLQQAASDDPFVQTAAVIVKALHRAIFELMESKRIGDNAYVFHHLALVFDGVQELYRLTAEAMGHIGSERLLPEEHGHNALLERRWQAEGI